MNRFTVLGASGFIGSHLVSRIKSLGSECYAPGRDEQITKKSLGTVIYCIGVTADFRSRLFDTISAHVCKLREVLQDCKFETFLYLSSTRVYGARGSLAREEDPINVQPSEADDLYNISKLMGESLALTCDSRCKVARLSNVYGPDLTSLNFISCVIREAIETRAVTLQTALESCKDYVSIERAVEILLRIAIEGKERIYNVASGVNTTNAELTDALHLLTGASFNEADGAPSIKYPRIAIDRIRDEFNVPESSIIPDLGHLVEIYKTNLKAK